MPVLPIVLEASRHELEALKALQLKPRCDWPAWFSTNSKGDVWPDSTFSFHPENIRRYVQGENSLLDHVALIYRAIRREGGRMFVNDAGAHFKERSGPALQFVAFTIVWSPRRQNIGHVARTAPPLGREAHSMGICQQESCTWCIEDRLARLRSQERRVLDDFANQLLGTPTRRRR